MDIKTLEYMGTRVDKARNIKRAIVATEESIKRLETEGLGRCSLDLNKGYMNIDISEITHAIKSAALIAFINRRDSLQKELDEL